MRKLAASAIVVLSLALLAGCVGGSEPTVTATASATPELVVPDVVGMNGAEAAAELRDAGLIPEPKWNGGNTVDSDLFDVLGQAPSAGEEIEPGDVVTLDVGAPPIPEYTVDMRSDSEYAVTVDDLVSQRDAHWIVREIADSQTAEGGYFVSINCATGGTDAADNRLANGKFAVGQRGAALTGLAVGASEAEIVADRTCPA